MWCTARARQCTSVFRCCCCCCYFNEFQRPCTHASHVFVNRFHSYEKKFKNEINRKRDSLEQSTTRSFVSTWRCILRTHTSEQKQKKQRYTCRIAKRHERIDCGERNKKKKKRKKTAPNRIASRRSLDVKNDDNDQRRSCGENDWWLNARVVFVRRLKTLSTDNVYCTRCYKYYVVWMARCRRK